LTGEGAKRAERVDTPPVSRFSAAVITTLLVAFGVVTTISVRTVQRW
jgi:hypothetical protein